jgi:hypothetical protein
VKNSEVRQAQVSVSALLSIFVYANAVVLCTLVGGGLVGA